MTEADSGPADNGRKATNMGGPGDGRWVEKTDKDIHPEEEFITKQRQNLNPHPSPQEKKEHLSTKGYLLLVLFFFPPRLLTA